MPCSGCCCLPSFIFMRDFGRLLELVVRNSAPLPSVGEIFLYTLPTAFMVTLPMGVLVGILIGLSRLAADSEVTAIRASGMGAGMFVRVVSIFAIAAWLLGNVQQHLRRAQSAATALSGLQNRLKTSQASFEIQPRVFYEEFKNHVLYVQDAIPSKGQSLWRGVFLADVSDPASPDYSRGTRRASERVAREGPLPSRGWNPTGAGSEGEGPVLDHYLREYRPAGRTAQQRGPRRSRSATGCRTEPARLAAQCGARTCRLELR